MKWYLVKAIEVWVESLSARRGWIEINGRENTGREDESLSARRVWIEIVDNLHAGCISESLSARRVWIEM